MAGSARRRRPVPSEMLDSGGRDRNERIALRTSAAADQAEFVGLFPHGQARARGSPCFDRLTVRSGIGTDPLQEVQDQAVNVVVHEPRVRRTDGVRACILGGYSWPSAFRSRNDVMTERDLLRILSMFGYR